MTIPKINTVLYANAIFCAGSTLLILLLPGMLATYVIDLPRSAFLVLGVALLVFAVDVALLARQDNPSRGRVLTIFIADLAWVVVTPVVMLTLQERITGLGSLLLVDIALIVAVFAWLEWVNLRRQEA